MIFNFPLITERDLYLLPDKELQQVWDALGVVLKYKCGILPSKPHIVKPYMDTDIGFEVIRQCEMG